MHFVSFTFVSIFSYSNINLEDLLMRKPHDFDTSISAIKKIHVGFFLGTLI